MTFRRGSILFGVMLVVVLATLVASTAVFRVRNNTDIVRASIREDSSRALLRSGLRVLLTEFEDARVELLRGGVLLTGDSSTASPLRISDGHVISELGNRRGIMRLLPQPSGELFSPESVRIDINRAPREMMLSLPGVTEAAVDAIIARRESRPFESIEELLAIDEITPSMLLGDLEVFAQRYRPADESIEDRSSQAQSFLAEPILADLITVYSADPSVRSAIENASSDTVGEPRLLFPSEVLSRNGDSLEITESAREFLTPDEAQRLEGATDEQSLLRRVITGIAPERRGLVLDAISASPDPFVLGRVDLTNASEKVLAMLPGLDEKLAAEIVARRSSLSESRLASATWPLEEGIISGEQFLELAPWIVARSMQFRVLIEAGFEIPTDGPRSGDFAALELDQRIVAEAVIDISGERARIAYLRDVTWLGDALKIHTIATEEQAIDPEQWYDFPDPFAGPVAASGGEDDGSSFERPSDRADQQRRELRRNRPEVGEPQTERRALPPTQPTAPGQGQDRRIGRWNGNPRAGGNR